jgi:hypothetical protein
VVIGLLVIAAVVIYVTGSPNIGQAEPTGMLIQPTSETAETDSTEVATEEAEQDGETPEPEGEEPTPGPGETAVSETPLPEATALAVPEKDGALIAVQMESQVGVLLNGYPESIRERVAESLIAAPEEHWEELARRQVRYTVHRLNFRNFIYPGKGQLPLPPRELWNFELDSEGPVLEEIGDLQFVLLNYTFSSTLLTDEESPFQAEPELGEEGGLWEEGFVLPLDPDYVFQRIDNACINEGGFPPNSYDSENAWVFFDHTCIALSGGPAGCHRLQLPEEDCIDAMERATGISTTQMVFERLEWDDDLADEVRVGEITQLEGPDLAAIGEDLQDYRVVYRYFPPESCGIVEGCVSGSGWRRLLMFKATVHNQGVEALSVGPAASENPLANFFQYNSCHDHFHFNGYGDFSVADADEEISSKQAFCVESTNRFSNNEFSPLTHPFTCRNQGVQAGWVDEYIAGLDCQWVDITDFEIEEEDSVIVLGFGFNPDQFICEGTVVRDENGNPAFETTDLTSEDGRTIQRPQCEFVEDYEVNNNSSAEIFVSPSGGFVTAPCAGAYYGPLRNCGLTEVPQLLSVEAAQSTPASTSEATPAAQTLEQQLFSCTPGDSVFLSCQVPPSSPPQVLRICEFSQLLGVGVACVFSDSMVNWVITEQPVNLGFTCPFVRDENEPGGRYSFYTGPAFGEDEFAEVSCTLQ